jgi:hypothetical protein
MMMPLLKNRLFVSVVGAVLMAMLALAIYEGRQVDMAHSTFENYYAFRGCVQLIDKTDTMGRCKTADGQTITLVKFHNQWYLDGDLPMCWGTICM